MLFGEISGSALAGIETALSRFLKPLLSESDGWGKADTEQKVLIFDVFSLCCGWFSLFGSLDVEICLVGWVDQKKTDFRQNV